MYSDIIKFTENNSCLILNIYTDELDLKGTPQLSKYIDDKLAEVNYSSLIIDLNNISYIDSMGIAMLIDINKKIISAGNRLALYCNNDSILQVLNVTQIERFIKIFRNLSESIKYINGC